MCALEYWMDYTTLYYQLLQFKNHEIKEHGKSQTITYWMETAILKRLLVILQLNRNKRLIQFPLFTNYYKYHAITCRKYEIVIKWDSNDPKFDWISPPKPMLEFEDLTKQDYPFIVKNGNKQILL